MNIKFQVDAEAKFVPLAPCLVWTSSVGSVDEILSDWARNAQEMDFPPELPQEIAEQAYSLAKTDGVARIVALVEGIHM